MNKLMIGSLAVLSIATVAIAGSPKSGLAQGERVSPFHPKHIVGALADTTDCFPCTFKNRPQVQVWLNGDSEANAMAIDRDLDKSMSQYAGKEFKALMVFIVPEDKQSAWSTKLKAAAKAHSFKNVSMALIAPNHQAIRQYKINTDGAIKNTVFVYKDWTVANTMINLKADASGLKALNSAIASIAK